MSVTLKDDEIEIVSCTNNRFVRFVGAGSY